MPTKRSTSKRESTDTSATKTSGRREMKGQSREMEDAGRSAGDRKRAAETTEAGYGDRGERKRAMKKK